MEKIEDPEIIAMQFHDCINNRNVEGLLELMTDDHVFIDMANTRIEGKSEVISMAWIPFFNIFPDYRNVIENVSVKNQTVIMRGYSVCSDERLNKLHAVWVAEVVDNKVNVWHIYPNDGYLATKQE
jgi:SnoaL-like polyketide cyclase.